MLKPLEPVSTPTRVLLGIATLALTMTLFFTGGVTMGYTIARREVMEPYQGLAKRATPFAARGVPVVYYNIVPRRPSMLYYSDYSPFERKETPLLPFLQTLPIQKRWQQTHICNPLSIT